MRHARTALICLALCAVSFCVTLGCGDSSTDAKSGTGVPTEKQVQKEQPKKKK